MPVLMIFEGGNIAPDDKFYPLKLSIRESNKQYLSANVVDYYAFKTQHPIVSDVRQVELVRELTKRPTYCLLMCDTGKTSRQEGSVDLIYIYLYSSNLDEVFKVKLTSTEALILDPVRKLIECHTSGTISEEMVKYQVVPKAPEKVLNEDDIAVLTTARDEKNYATALASVRSVFPKQTLNSKQAIKQFCARHIDKFNKEREQLSDKCSS